MDSKMPRSNNRKSAVFDHFTKSPDGKHYVCQCLIKDLDVTKVCNAKISAFRGIGKQVPSRAYNLKRHVLSFHPELLRAAKEEDYQPKEELIPNTMVQVEYQEPSQISIPKYFDYEEITVKMTSDAFKKHVVELVVREGVPLSLFSSPAFLGLNGEMAFKCGVSLEADSVVKLVAQEALHCKEELKKAIKKRFLLLKMDVCSYKRVNYVAISARFIGENSKIVTKTLAVTIIDVNHTSWSLHNLVEKVLKDYEIKKDQVLCAISDSASNMIYAVELRNADSDCFLQPEEFSRFREAGTSEIGESFLNIIEQGEVVTEQQDALLNDLIEATSGLSHMNHMRCAAHMLQLVMIDGLQEFHSAALISKMREFVTELRTPEVDSILKRQAGKGAVLDETRHWYSTYLMIRRLRELKPFLMGMVNPCLTLKEDQWAQVAEFEEILRLPFILLHKFQTEDLTPGLFLKEWRNLIFCLTKRGGLIANVIADTMKQREVLLLENKLFLAAVYVDPMHRILLDDRQLTGAKDALFEIAVRLRGQGKSLEKEPVIDAAMFSSTEDDLDFEKYLDCKERARNRRKAKDSLPPKEEKLSSFQEIFSPALKQMEDINRFSKASVPGAINLYPEIVRDAALIVTALPPTQVSIRRLISTLREIKSDLNASKKEGLIDAVLFLRANFQ